MDHSIQEPLIVNNKEVFRKDETQLGIKGNLLDKNFRRNCACLGAWIGIFMQLAVVGASSLLDQIWGEEGPTKYQIVVSTVSWSLITAGGGCSVMLIFRNFFVDITYRTIFVSSRHTSTLAADASFVRGTLEELICCFECYYALGVLASITLTWMASCIILGTPTTFLEKYLTLALPVLWCVCSYAIAKENKIKKCPQKEGRTSRNLLQV